jgi:hypothetical protein
VWKTLKDPVENRRKEWDRLNNTMHKKVVNLDTYDIARENWAKICFKN